MTNTEWREQREKDVERAFKKAAELVRTESQQLSEVSVTSLIMHLTDRLLDERFGLYGGNLTAAGAQMLEGEQ